MAAPGNINEFLDLVRKSGVLEDKRLDVYVQQLAGSMPSDPAKLAGLLVRDGLLTQFQAEQIMQGKWRRFSIGKYKVLERIGSGGMGSVYLCEHKMMRRRVAIKVLPPAKAADPSALERFYREARAVAALDHLNIVHAYDIDQDETLHFLVMEYVDGSSLQDIVKKVGPLEPIRAAHYIRQAAIGLDHAHRTGLVHRDIKPGNLLIDRSGIVKILDMGLARFFNDEEDVLTKKYDENVLGTADYLAPEQALDSHAVDIRADIYSLGATFYYLLTGRTPFGEGTVAQKLIWHQTRQPKPVSTYRQDVPPGLMEVIEKMMAKDPDQRYLVPGALAQALEPWTQTAIPPPSETEMPKLSLAAMASAGASLEMAPPAYNPAPAPAPAAPPAAPQPPAKGWTVTTPQRAPASPAPPPAAPPKAPAPPAQPAPVAAKLSGQRERPQASPPRGSQPEMVLPSPAQGSPSVELVPKSPSAKPSSAPPVAIQELAPPEANSDEDVAWQELALATKDSISKANTPSSQRSGSGRRSGGKAAPVVEDRRTWYLIAGVVVVCIVLLVLAWLFLFGKSGDPVVPETKPLIVTKDANYAGGYRSIFLALHSSKDGDVIELMDEDHQESLRWDPQDQFRVKHVTIKAAVGKSVTWKPSPGKDEKNNLLYLSNAHGLSIMGPNLTLDGTIDLKKNSFVQDLIFLYSFNKGLVLQDLTVQNFKNTGVVLLNCGGVNGQPVRLTNLEIKAAKNTKPRAGIFLDAFPNMNPPQNEYVEIDKCTFSGIDPKKTISIFDKARGFNVDLPKNGVEILVKPEPAKPKPPPPKVDPKKK